MMHVVNLAYGAAANILLIIRLIARLSDSFNNNDDIFH